MCQVVSSGQQYANKTQQMKQTVNVEQPQQQQKVVQPVYQETETYNTVTIDTSYSDFMERFNPLSGTAVEGKQPPAEEKLSWKQRKRRNKDFKEWYQLKVDDAKERPGLVSAKDLNKMIFGDFDKKDREHWEKQVLPHSKLTRGETLRRIIEEGDYSNFENLDELMRNRVATLTHVPDLITVTSYYRKKKSKDPSGDAADAIKANNAQQIQLAKRLLLMQMSDFYTVIKDENGTKVPVWWDKTMAVAFSHCSRVALTLPRLEENSSVNNAHGSGIRCSRRDESDGSYP